MYGYALAHILVLKESPGIIALMLERLQNFKGLAIKGGGAAGISYLGSLRKWEDAKLKLDQFTHIVGSSAGSILAALLSVRAPLSFLEAKMKTDFSSFLDTSIISKAEDVAALIKRYGWHSGNGLETWIANTLGELTGNPEITFSEAYAKYGVHLIITATDVFCSECKLVVMDWTTSPDMKIHAAVRRSCSIPFFFQAVFGAEGTPEAGHVFIDGGVTDNYPIELLYQYLPKEQCMGLFLTSVKSDVVSLPASSYMELVSSIVNTWSDAMTKINIKPEDWERTCLIPTELKTTDFAASMESKEKAISSAWTAMEHFIYVYVN